MNSQTVSCNAQRPYVEEDILYLPRDQSRLNAVTRRWYTVTRNPVISVVRIEWTQDANINDLGWIAEWVFFVDGQEVNWSNIEDQVTVAYETRQSTLVPHPADIIPWSDDIETLVALERL